MRRPPTLLLLTAGALVAVLAAGVTVLVARATHPRHGAERAALPAFAPEAASRPVAAPAAPPPPPPPAPPPVVSAPPGGPAPPNDADLPIWMRKPLRTSQPFPPEAAIDPPHPPYKVPAWMIGSRPDAASALPDAADDR